MSSGFLIVYTKLTSQISQDKIKIRKLMLRWRAVQNGDIFRQMVRKLSIINMKEEEALPKLDTLQRNKMENMVI